MGTAFARWGVLVLRGGRLTVRMGYRRPSTIRENVLDYAISERLQELIELLFADAANHLFQASAEILFVLKHKPEADAVVAPADGSRIDGDRTLGGWFLGIRECHSHHRAWVPALVGDHVQSGRTDILNDVLHRSAAGPEIGS